MFAKNTSHLSRQAYCLTHVNRGGILAANVQTIHP